MPSHRWSSKIHSSSCSRCGVTRTAIPVFTGREEAPTRTLWSYRLPDGYGSLEKRPLCNRASESRRTRKMGRRSKVMARSRAGGHRLISKEAQVKTYKMKITTAALPDPGPTSRAEVIDGVLHIITTEVVPTAATFSVGAAGPEISPDDLGAAHTVSLT